MTSAKPAKFVTECHKSIHPLMNPLNEHSNKEAPLMHNAFGQGGQLPTLPQVDGPPWPKHWGATGAYSMTSGSRPLELV